MSTRSIGAMSDISDAEVAAKVMAFETALARHHWDRVACRDAEKTYNKFSIDLGQIFQCLGDTGRLLWVDQLRDRRQVDEALAELNGPEPLRLG